MLDDPVLRKHVQSVFPQRQHAKWEIDVELVGSTEVDNLL